MCFTKRKQRAKQKHRSAKVYPEPNVLQGIKIQGKETTGGKYNLPGKTYENITTKDFIEECISCYNCKRIFKLGSNELKIHCSGCNNFFHCGIAGKCIGKNCSYTDTLIGESHSLSWCVNCVPKLRINILSLKKKN